MSYLKPNLTTQDIFFTRNRLARCGIGLGLGLALWMHSAAAAETWAFEPAEDTFAAEALLDLRSLNEEQAGQSGWVHSNKAGDFVRGDGQPIRFWAVNTGVGNASLPGRPLWTHMAPHDLAKHARWLAKRGVNMIRCGEYMNPDPKTQELEEINSANCERVWKVVGAMAKEGIYSTISPYWAHLVKSDDARWGTDWKGEHSGLLFFDPRMQAAYKSWLRHLFTTPTPHLGGKTLAEHAGLAIFQIQNEDSLLFWTVNGIKGPAARRLGARFGEWAVAKYGSLDKAYATWGDAYSDQDDRSAGIPMLMNLWNLTRDGRSKNVATPRVNDQLQFITELMHKFNAEIERFISEDLHCPVLVNAGNWKSGDTVLLDDAERYSYTANEVIAVNRYFSGMHNGENRGWAIINGDEYTNKSALRDGALDFPLNLKQVAGRPMIITESIWVFPEENAFESSLMVAAYASLTGFDGFYWNEAESNDWSPPMSANGYLPSQRKWIAMTPDQAGQWPGAAYLWRKGLLQRGKPVVQEHRSLAAIYDGKTPIIAESASFDPNRDAGDLAANSSVKTGVSPWAFLTGPVTVTYDSEESKSAVIDLQKLIKPSGSGMRVESVTHELVLDTGKGLFTVNAPQCQAFAGHFTGETTVSLADVSVTTSNRELSVSAIAMDDQPLTTSARVLIQIGTRCRPTGWTTEPITITPQNSTPVSGFRVTNYGQAPWQVRSAKATLTIANQTLKRAAILDVNGMPLRTVDLKPQNGRISLELPDDALYVMLLP